MEENQVYEDLSKNIHELDDIEQEIAMIELAIYQKNIEELKDKKLQELIDFFDSQAKFYNQKNDNYKEKINNITNLYLTQFDKLVNSYDNLYLSTFKILRSALDNQKIAIANIITLKEKIKENAFSEAQLQEVHNTIRACAQKKLNYAVVVEECKARIMWIIENSIKDINEIFKSSMLELQKYDDSIFSKLKRYMFNMISGKNKYKRFLENYKSNYIKDIEKKNAGKILDVTSALVGVMKQIENVNNQIANEYNKMICAT